MTYSRNSKVSQVRNADVYSTIFQGVKSVIGNRKSPWIGTMTELGRMLENKVSVSSVLPGSPSALRVALNKVVRRLRDAGISVRFSRDTSHTRTRLVEIFAR